MYELPHLTLIICITQSCFSSYDAVFCERLHVN